MPGSLWVRGGRVVAGDGVSRADVWIVDGVVKAVGQDLAPPRECAELDATGKLVFPGLIDPQVHFREPGLTHKEDLASGTYLYRLEAQTAQERLVQMGHFVLLK